MSTILSDFACLRSKIFACNSSQSCIKLQECINKHIEHVLGNFATPRTDQRAPSIAVNVVATQLRVVTRKAVGEIIDEGYANISMRAEYFSRHVDENGDPCLRKRSSRRHKC